MLMLILMTLTLMQGHSGSANAKNQCCCMPSATKQAISIKIATNAGHFYMTLTLQTHIYIWLDHLVFRFWKSRCLLGRSAGWFYINVLWLGQCILPYDCSFCAWCYGSLQGCSCNRKKKKTFGIDRSNQCIYNLAAATVPYLKGAFGLALYDLAFVELLFCCEILEYFKASFLRIGTMAKIYIYLV